MMQVNTRLVYDTVYSPYREDKIFKTELEFQYGIIKSGQDYIKSLYDTHKHRNETWNKLREEGILSIIMCKHSSRVEEC